MKLLINMMGDYMGLDNIVSDFNFGKIKNMLPEGEDKLDLPNIELFSTTDDKYYLDIKSSDNDLEIPESIVGDLNKSLRYEDFETALTLLTELNKARYPNDDDVIGLYNNDTTIRIGIPNNELMRDIDNETDDTNSVTLFTNYMFKAQEVTDDYDMIVIINNPNTNVSNNITHLQEVVNSCKLYTLVMSNNIEFLKKNLEYSNKEIEFEEL